MAGGTGGDVCSVHAKRICVHARGLEKSARRLAKKGKENEQLFFFSKCVALKGFFEADRQRVLFFRSIVVCLCLAKCNIIRGIVLHRCCCNNPLTKKEGPLANFPLDKERFLLEKKSR